MNKPGLDKAWISLPAAVEEIRVRCDGDLVKARQTIMDADEIGDLDVRLRCPDGSTNRLRDVIANLDAGIWEELFRTGLLNAPPRRPRWKVQDRRSMRRVQPTERCRIVVMRASLDQFEKALGPAATAGAETRAIAHLRPLLEHNPAMSKDTARKACKQFKLSGEGFEKRVWPDARVAAGLSRKASPGAKPHGPAEIGPAIDQIIGPNKSSRKSRS
jgi:hypothetical protein